ncbi:MAG: EF-hand domain-containing protein [Desulforhabdus sp.]|jgi:hypothetical protein|nr:EF-hand domain-containing protein [Desulforhabdus sp.]
MKSYTCLLMMVMVIILSGGIAAAQMGQGGGAGQLDPKAMCQQRFDRIDANQDGTVDKTEFMQAQEEMFKMRDADSSGHLTKEEFCPERPGPGMGMGPKKQ